jgi:hypothetical protein
MEPGSPEIDKKNANEQCRRHHYNKQHIDQHKPGYLVQQPEHEPKPYQDNYQRNYKSEKSKKQFQA